MALAKLESILDSLKSDSQTKKNDYTLLQKYINNQELTFIPEESLLAIIKKHLQENVMVNEALATWTLYIKKTKNITEDFIENVYHHLKDFDILIPLFCELLTENLLDLEKILSNNNMDLNKNILNSLTKVSDEVTFKIYFDFINNNVVRTIYTIKSDENRNLLIDFVLLKYNICLFTFYSSDEQKRITATFKNSYVQVIDNLRMQNNRNWYKLCMFTMKYCGKLLHSEIELTNAILRNVEIGFKTKTLQDRLMSYECWKVLIDICNLDKNYICSSKQLRLLVKPLKVKLSKSEEVIRKRFDIWFYLIKILQEKLILCLEEFLRFCFGLSNNNSVSEISIECEMIKSTWISRVEVLMAIIGHSNHEGNCLKMQDFNFKTPLVTSTNFLEYDDLLINSIYVACKMISTWDDNTDKVDKVRCLWTTLFRITQNLNENSKESILHKISKVVNCLLQDAVNNEKIFDDVIIPIFSLFSHFEEPICNSLLLHEILIFPIIRFMLSLPTVKTKWSKEVVNLIRNVPKTGNKLFYFNRVCELLKTSSRTNNAFIVHFWLQLSDELYDICKTPREGFSDFKEDAMYFLTRIFSCNNFEDMQNLVLLKWKNIFSEICAISTVFGENLLENGEKLVKKQPETINNLLVFLPDISQTLFKGKSPKNCVVGLLNVIFYCLQNPCTPKDKIIMTVGVLKRVLNFCLSSENVEAETIISRMYECIEYLLKPHEVLEILEVFKEIVPKLTDSTKKKLPNSLKQILSELTVNSDTLISKDAVVILAQFHMEDSKAEPKPLFIKPITVSSRTAKIANMAKDNGFTTSPKGSMLKMFANDQKHNKTEISPSNKCTSPRSRTRNIIKAVPSQLTEKMKNVDDDSREFVLINKEVKLDKKKMSEHQKEMRNKRREDIPALYQDLSQSQQSSADISSSVSNDDTTSNKSDLMLDVNFKEMITDLQKKNNILQENLNAELTESVKIDTHNNTLNSDSSTGPSSKDVRSEQGNSLPKYDLNVNFEKALENQRNDITRYNEKVINQNQQSIHAREADKNNPVFCSSKFEEQDVKIEAAQAPVFPEYNLERMCVTSDKSPKKKHKHYSPKSKTDNLGSSSVNSKQRKTQSVMDLDDNKNKSFRNRSISDSDAVLQAPFINTGMYEVANDENSLGNVELVKENLREEFKQQLKTKTREVKNKIRGKHRKSLFSNKQNKTFIQERRRRKSYEEIYRNDLHSNFELKKKYKSLENLNDMAKKRKKCFKIIRNDSELSNSIKLRISITDERDNNPQPNILEQLDTEISNIDAHLKKTEFSTSRKADCVNSESIFGSSEALFDPEDHQLDDVEANRGGRNLLLSDGNESSQGKLDTHSETNLVDSHAVMVDAEHLDDSFNLKYSENEKTVNSQKRKQRELERIKMDIVGAEEFIVTTPRKRRAPKLLDSPSSKENSRNKTPNRIKTGNSSPQKTTSQKRINKKKVDNTNNSAEINKQNYILNNEILKKSSTPDSTMTPRSSKNSLTLTDRRKRKTNNVALKEILEDVTKTNLMPEIKEYNQELLQENSEEFINLSDASVEKNNHIPVKLTTRNVKKSSKLKTINKLSENTKKSVNTPKIVESKRKTRRTFSVKTPEMSPLAFSPNSNQPRSIPKRKGRKGVKKISLKSVAPKRLSSPVQDYASLQQDIVDDNLENSSENIIESSQDTTELLKLSRTLKKSQKSYVKENSVSSVKEPASLKSINITIEDSLHPKSIDQQDNSLISDEIDQQVESQISDAPTETDETKEISSELILSAGPEYYKSPEQNTDNYICEINGIAINNIGSEGGEFTCEVSDLDDTEVIVDEIGQLDNHTGIEAQDQTIDKNIETDDASENIQIKEEITIVNHNVADYCNSYVDLKINKDIFDDKEPVPLEQDTKDTIKPDVTEASDIKAENIDHEETLTCDPYTNIHNDKDVLAKLETAGPGAVRTIIRDLNFDSLPIVFDTTPKKGSIPSSPVCEDTPDRNKEFLNNTLDISPIKTESASIEVLEKDIKTPVVSDRSYIKKPSSRSAKLLNLLPCNTEITPIKSIKIQMRKATTSSEASTVLSTQRIRKMILNCGRISQVAAVKEGDDIAILEDITCEDATTPLKTIAENAILKFTRELPSPLATPNSSILKKRKLSEVDETIVPIAKRPKRVNFSDPPITCKKIYFMENEEKSDDSNDASSESPFSIMTNLNLTKANSIYPRLSTCMEDINGIVTILNEDILTQFHSINVKTIGDLAVLNDAQIDRLEFLSEPRLSRVIDALDIFYSSYTEKDKASTDTVASSICPSLIDCTHSIQNILKFIGNVKTAKDFRLKNITTIGALAKLTKAEIVQLSLKPSNILNALQKYQRKLNKDRILAKQLEEEMNEEKAASVDLDDASVSQSSNADTRLDVLEVKEIQTDIVPIPDKTVDAPTQDEKRMKELTLKELIQYIKENCSTEEMRTIFDELKDILYKQ